MHEVIKLTEKTNKQEEQPKHYHDWEHKPSSTRGYKMNKKCKSCGEEIKNIFPATTFEGFIRRWVHGKLNDKNKKGKIIKQTSCGNYNATDNEIYYYGAGRKVSTGKEVLALKLPDGRIIGNAARLQRCGSYRAGSEAPAQRVMQQLEMAMIPFNVFEEANLNLFEAEVVEQGKAEKLTLPKLEWNNWKKMLLPVSLWEHKTSKTKPKPSNKIRNIGTYTSYTKDKAFRKYSYEQFNNKNLEQRHFIGAMLLRVSDKYFLFDVDRQELKYYRFNAFLSELPKSCKTINEAYDSLIPTTVKRALSSNKKVLRQGEWFFIPMKLPKAVKADNRSKQIIKRDVIAKKFDLPYWATNSSLDDESIKNRLAEIDPKFREGHLERIKAYNASVNKYRKALSIVHRENPNKYASSGTLKAGDNRPNYVDKHVSLPEGTFVSGKVEHSGREHEPIMLKGWYKPIPNTAVNSFTIEGNID